VYAENPEPGGASGDAPSGGGSGASSSCASSTGGAAGGGAAAGAGGGGAAEGEGGGEGETCEAPAGMAERTDAEAVRTLQATWMQVTTWGSLHEQGGRLARREAALERVGCVAALAQGDVLYFDKAVYHRTQDTAVVARVTMQADLV